MKTLAAILMACAFVFAACGHDHDGNDNHSHNGACGEDGHGHSHDGPRHLIGEKKYDDGYYVGLAHIGSIVAGKEVMFEVLVKKDGNDVKDAIALIWLVDKDGNELTRRVDGKWMPDENLYDTHLMLPKDLPEGTKVMVEVRHGGKKMAEAHGIKGHDHD
jgi:hypothetical protein